ncbi:hypothetical protein L6452_28857 [Arctium lappa]|uniref:Uncharacterized protein n=1 Tax=Arctium lappa TaxID=4217 RepID=A0ACB8ZYN8_ARCLA|nr:hypothetical protein L6452_28857 [Arctium lappa]
MNHSPFVYMCKIALLNQKNIHKLCLNVAVHRGLYPFAFLMLLWMFIDASNVHPDWQNTIVLCSPKMRRVILQGLVLASVSSVNAESWGLISLLDIEHIL